MDSHKLSWMIILNWWTGVAAFLRDYKKGTIPDHLPGILQRLDLDAKQFI